MANLTAKVRNAKLARHKRDGSLCFHIRWLQLQRADHPASILEAFYLFPFYQTHLLRRKCRPVHPSKSHAQCVAQSPVLEFSIFVTMRSVAPTSVNLSMAIAISFLSTIACTATQPSSSNALTVGARRPGVILRAISSFDRSMLYVHRTYFCAAARN